MPDELPDLSSYVVKAPSKPRRGGGVFTIQNDGDPSKWSLDVLPRLDSDFQAKFGRKPTYGRIGQGSGVGGWHHENNVDFSDDPDTPQGQFIMDWFRQNNLPFRASTVGGVQRNAAGRIISTGKHIHGGPPSSSFGPVRAQRASAGSLQQSDGLPDLSSYAVKESPTPTPARRNEVTVPANQTVDVSTLQPARQTVRPLRPRQSTQTVLQTVTPKQGQNLIDIASQYKVGTKDLARLNGMVDWQNPLPEGTQIKVPVDVKGQRPTRSQYAAVANRAGKAAPSNPGLQTPAEQEQALRDQVRRALEERRPGLTGGVKSMAPVTEREVTEEVNRIKNADPQEQGWMEKIGTLIGAMPAPYSGDLLPGPNGPEPARISFGEEGNQLVREGALGSVANTLQQVGNLTAGTRESPLTKAGRVLQGGVQKSIESHPAQSTVGEIGQGVVRGVAALPLEYAKLVGGGELLGAANLPVQGVLSDPEHPASAAVKGLVYHYGMGVTARLGRVGNALVWTAAPAAESVVEGQPVGKAIGGALPFGALALQTHPAEVSENGKTRPATIEDAPRIEKGELEVVPPPERLVNDPDVQAKIQQARGDVRQAVNQRFGSTIAGQMKAKGQAPLVAEKPSLESLIVRYRDAQDKGNQTELTGLAQEVIDAGYTTDDFVSGIQRATSSKNPEVAKAAQEIVRRAQAPASGAQISPEQSLPADAAQSMPETVTEAEPHYSTNQNRRVRNTATGNKGQFKPGFKESEDATTPSVEQSQGQVEGANATPPAAQSNAVASESSEQPPTDFYSQIRGADQKDYKQKVEQLDGYKSLEDERESIQNKQSFYSPGDSQYQAFDKRLDEIDRALHIQVEQGAKRFGISPDDFVGVVNDYLEDKTAIKRKLLPSNAPSPSAQTQGEVNGVERNVGQPSPELARSANSLDRDTTGRGPAEVFSDRVPEAPRGNGVQPGDGESVSAPTGPKVEVTRAEREARGLSPVERQAYQTMGASYEAGKAEVERGTIDPRTLAEEVSKKPRNLSATETGALGYDRARLLNAHDAVMSEIEKAMAAGDDVRAAEGRSRLSDIERHLDNNDTALDLAGREWSMAGQARKAMIRKDYSLAEMVRRYKVETGKEATPEVRAKIEEQARQIKDLQAKVDAHEAEKARQAEEEAVNRAKEDIKREQRRAKRATTRDEIDKEWTVLKTEIKVALKDIGKVKASGLAGLDPEGKIASAVGKMVRNRVKAGVNTIDGLVDEVHSVIKDYVADLTKRDVRDLISGYGKTAEMNQSPEAKQLRELRQQMRLISAIEDAESGEKPAKSGLQREPEGAKARLLRRQLLDELKKQGIRAPLAPKQGPRLGEGVGPKEGPRLGDKLGPSLREGHGPKEGPSLGPKQGPTDWLPGAKKAIETRINEIQERISNNDFASRPKLDRTLDREGLRLKAQLEKVKQDYEVLKYKNSLTRGQRVKNTVVDVLNVPRSLKSSVDLSAPRQTAMWLVSHPVEGAKLFFGKQLRAMRQVNYDDYAQQLKSDPDFTLMQNSGLSLSTAPKFNAKLSAREEAFMSKLAGKIPGVSHSERAYTTFIDTARVSWFKQLKAQTEDAAKGKPITPEQYQAIAKFVNIGTGRGDLGRGTLNSISPVLNSLFFAPRYAASKIQVFDPRVYARLPAGARKTAVRQAVQYFGTVASVALMLKYGMNQNVGTNPDDSDFGKLVVGNTHYDLTNGQGSYFTFAARLFKNAQNKIEGKKDEWGKGAWDNVTRFLRYKLAPIPAAAVSTWEGKNAVGEKTSAGKEGLDLITPLFLNDLYEAYSKEGAQGVLKSSPGFVGVGVQNYSPNQRRGRR